MVKIAFLISAHTDALHLKRLIESLPGSASFYIHIDRKANIDEYKKAVLTTGTTDSQEKSSRKICFIEERYDVMWGSFGQVRYQIALLKAALAGEEKPDYFISLSGLDYPLWSNQQIMDYIDKHKEDNLLQAICMTNQKEAAQLYREYRFLNEYSWKYGSVGSKFRVAIRHIVKALGFRKPLVIKSPGHERNLYKGGSWWGLSRDLAEFVIHVWNNEPAFCRYFKTAFAPDETFIHTIAFNSQHRNRCILSTGPFTCLEDLSPLTYIEYKNEIKVFTEKDFDTLIASGKMFCRKTISGKSDGLLDKIDIYRRTKNH